MDKSPDGGANSRHEHLSWREPAVLTAGIATGLITGYAIAYAISISVRYDSIPLEPGSVSDKAVDVLMFALMSAFLAFGTLELIKRLTPLRGRLQRRWVMSLFESGVGPKKGRQAFDELVSLTGRRALSLPVEQFAAVASTAVDLAVVRSEGSSTLVDALETASRPRPKGGVTPTARDDDVMALSASLRIGIDQLQIGVGERWRRIVQSSAVGLASAYGLAMSFAVTSTAREQPRYILTASVLGGPLAWFIRDLTALAERARR